MLRDIDVQLPSGSTAVSFQGGGEVPALCAKIQGLQASLLASHYQDTALLRQSLSRLAAENERLRAALGSPKASPAGSAPPVPEGTPAAAASGLSAPSPPDAGVALGLLAEAQLAANAVEPSSKGSLALADAVSIDSVVLQERLPVEQQLPGESLCAGASGTVVRQLAPGGSPVDGQMLLLPSIAVGKDAQQPLTQGGAANNTTVKQPKLLEPHDWCRTVSDSKLGVTSSVCEETCSNQSQHLMFKGNSVEDVGCLETGAVLTGPPFRREESPSAIEARKSRMTRREAFPEDDSDGSEDAKASPHCDKASIQRVKQRLGLTEGENKLVTTPVLYHAITSLGLKKYEEADCRLVLKSMERYLRKERWLHGQSRSKSFYFERTHGAQARMSCCAHEMRKKTCLSRFIYSTKQNDKAFSDIMVAGHTMIKNVGHPQDSPIASPRAGSCEDIDAAVKDVAVEFDSFMRFLVAEDNTFRLGPETAERMVTIKEVLLTGEVNRIVAELANVRVDDLASPPPSIDLLTALEPIVSLVIVGNAVFLGLETDPALGLWHGWSYFEWAFITIFVLELVLRVYVTGSRLHFCGPDFGWNWFDFMVLMCAFLEQVLELDGSSGILRLLRITRLTRLVRMLRFDCLKELTLMMKGLVAGLRTLGWAIVLLFATIYTIAVGITETLGKSDELLASFSDGDRFFSTVPRSMFFVFRCFTSDCGDSEGRPMVDFLERRYGWTFIIPYVCSVMLITFGIFNLIIAIYIESTMTAAKHEQEVDKKRRMNESLRIARATKKLLKKFCRAISAFNEPLSTAAFLNVSQEHIESKLAGDGFDEVQDQEMTVSKELFLMVIQDREVQALMDDLDIPQDRAQLFDVLDADSSGGLEVAELVQGLLSVRGETRKSEMVACLLGVRALQDMIRQVAMELRMEIRQVDKVVKKLAENGGVDPQTSASLASERCSVRPPSQLDSHRWKR